MDGKGGRRDASLVRETREIATNCQKMPKIPKIPKKGEIMPENGKISAQNGVAYAKALFLHTRNYLVYTQ